MLPSWSPRLPLKASSRGFWPRRLHGFRFAERRNDVKIKTSDRTDRLQRLSVVVTDRNKKFGSRAVDRTISINNYLRDVHSAAPRGYRDATATARAAGRRTRSAARRGRHTLESQRRRPGYSNANDAPPQRTGRRLNSELREEPSEHSDRGEPGGPVTACARPAGPTAAGQADSRSTPRTHQHINHTHSEGRL